LIPEKLRFVTDRHVSVSALFSSEIGFVVGVVFAIVG